MENRTRNAVETYEIIADWFSENRYQGLIEKSYLDQLISKMNQTRTVLDLGCGTGMPIANYLISQGLHLTGIDASSRMLAIARQQLPNTEFIHADMRQLNMGRKFDAIIAWHSFFHLPDEDQPAMFDIFKTHLKPNGLLLFTSGQTRGEAWGINGGQQLFHASLDTQEYKRLLKAHHFKILTYQVDDEGCGNATVWLVQLES